MLYTFALDIPANTLETAPEEEEIFLTHGVITHVEVEFHPGCSGLVEAYVRRGVHQIYPTNPEFKYHTDGRTISWQEYHEMFQPPFDLVIGGFSPGTSYDHEIIFRFEVTPKEVAERGKVGGQLLGKMARLLGLAK